MSQVVCCAFLIKWQPELELSTGTLARDFQEKFSFTYLASIWPGWTAGTAWASVPSQPFHVAGRDFSVWWVVRLLHVWLTFPENMSQRQGWGNCKAQKSRSVTSTTVYGSQWITGQAQSQGERTTTWGCDYPQHPTIRPSLGNSCHTMISPRTAGGPTLLNWTCISSGVLLTWRSAHCFCYLLAPRAMCHLKQLAQNHWTSPFLLLPDQSLFQSLCQHQSSILTHSYDSHVWNYINYISPKSLEMNPSLVVCIWSQTKCSSCAPLLCGPLPLSVFCKPSPSN